MHYMLHTTKQDVTKHHITLQYITWHNITSHYITISHYITLHRNTSHYITLHHVAHTHTSNPNWFQIALNFKQSHFESLLFLSISSSSSVAISWSFHPLNCRKSGNCKIWQWDLRHGYPMISPKAGRCCMWPPNPQGARPWVLRACRWSPPLTARRPHSRP